MADQRFIAEIKNRFCECSVCMSEYDERELTPRILPCNHTYCSQCLETLCRNHKLKCPQCNMKHQVKENGISAFRKDNTIRDLVSFLSSQERRFTCCNCTSTDIKYCCRLCKTFLCRTCKSCHINSMSKHHIIPNNRQMSTIPLGESPAFICYEENHERNELKFFCYSPQCRKVLCANCIAVAHRNHDIWNLFEIYEERKKVMKSKLMLLKSRVDSTKRKLKNIEGELENLQTKTQFAKELNKDKEETNEHIEVLEAKRAVLLNFCENSDECCIIAQKVLDEDIPTFLESENMLVVKLKEFVDFQFETTTTEVRKEFSNDESGINASFPYRERSRVKARKTYDKQFGCLIMIKWMYSIVVSLLWWIIKMHRNMLWWMPKLHLPITFRSIFDLVSNILLTICIYTSCLIFPLLARDPFFVIDGYENRSGVKFVDSNRNVTICANKNRQSFSSIPFENISQTCKSERLFYKYSGVFANLSFGNDKERHLDIDIFVKRLSTSWKSYGVILEFGFSAKIIHSKYIYNSKRRNVWGWCLTHVQNHFQFLTRNSSYTDNHMRLDIENTGRFTRRLRISVLPHNERITLNDRITSNEIDRIPYNSNTPLLWPVFSVFSSPDFLVKLKIVKPKGVSLNRESADTKIYLSRDNFTVSNKKTSDTWPVSKPTVNHFHYTNQLNCKHQCQYMMKVWFDQSIVAHDGFEIGLASYSPDFHIDKAISHLLMGKHSSCITDTRDQRHCLEWDNKFHVMARNWVTISVSLDVQNSKAYLRVNYLDLVSTVDYDNRHAHSIYFRLLNNDGITVHSVEKHNFLLFNYLGDQYLNRFSDIFDKVMSKIYY